MVQQIPTDPIVDVEATPKSITINGHKVVFEKRIWGHLVLPDRVIVMMDEFYRDNVDPNRARNIFCLDAKGQMIWRIEENWTTFYSEKFKKNLPRPYAGLYFGDDRKTVKVYLSVGYEFDLDPETGELSNETYAR